MRNRLRNIMTFRTVTVLALLMVSLSSLAAAQIFSPLMPKDNDSSTIDAPYIPNNIPKYNPVYSGKSTFDTVTNKTTESTFSPDHIDVYTSLRFQDFNYTSGSEVSIPLYLKFYSPTSLFTTIVIDPKSPYALNCYVSLGPNKGSIRINDYIDYNPKGTILLKNDTLVLVTMTIKMPKGLWPYDWPHPVPFNLYGVDNNVDIRLLFRVNIYV